MPEYICPHCRKPTYDDDALRCIYCGELLNRPVGFISDLKYSNKKIGFIIIATVVLVAAIFYLFRYR